MKKIRIAQIGTAHDHAEVVFDALTHLTDEFEVIGYAVPEDQGPLQCKQTAFKGYPRLTVEEVFTRDDIDAVVIETDELHLTDYALRAAQHGLAVHMDKPGGIDHAKFEEFVREMEKKSLPLSTGYMYRYNPAIRDALTRVKNGEIGQITSIDAQMNCLHIPEKRQWLDRFPGGMMFFLGCHLVDLALLFLGEPESITPFNLCSGDRVAETEDIGFAVLRYPNAVATVRASAVEPCGFLRRQLVIAGTKGTIEINPIERGVPNNGRADLETEVRLSITPETDIAKWGNIGAWETLPAFNRYDAMLRQFAATVRGDEPMPYSYDHELLVHKTLLAACGK